jgi:SAM-dependent methyltransferase
LLSFRDLRTPDDVGIWVAGLNERWPQRGEVIQHIHEQLSALPFPQPQVVELCTGPGLLAEALLSNSAQLIYTGFDSSELLLNAARRRLKPFEGRVRLVRADLNNDEWLAQLSVKVQAIISMQSLHDLGGEAQVNRIYQVARSLLAPGGLFLNADLVIPPGQDNPDNPGRRSIARHLELLKSHGYEQVACTFERVDFACVVGFAPKS